MNIDDYKTLATKYGYYEEKIFISHPEELLKNFVDYKKADLNLKIYLCELIIYRHFMPTGSILLPDDVHWFINEYFLDYNVDFVEPMRSAAIREAKDMIMSDDTFGKSIIGTVFMFAIVEFYAKYKLGFRPFQYDFFDPEKNAYTRAYTNSHQIKHIYIGQALDLIEQKNFSVSDSLRSINFKTNNKMVELGVNEERFSLFKISDRVKLARNTMMHGEAFAFFEKGRYLLMLYILFQLNETKENGEQNNL